MSLGRAYIEVHADLRSFKKDLDKGVPGLIKDTQKAVDSAVRESVSKASGGKGGKGAGIIRPKIKPDLDTKDADRQSQGFFRRFVGYGQKAWGGVVDGFAYAIKNSDSVETAGLVVAGIVATVASPLIAAAIAGAITAGIGLAGIGAGIALAFQDDRIQIAANQMWGKVMQRLEKASSVFVKPIGEGLAIVFAGVDRFIFRIERSFRALAPYVDDLATGIAGFLDALGPGLEATFSNAGPFIAIVAEYLPVIGDAIGYLFQRLSESEGARAGLVAFFQMLADAIVITADVIGTLTDAFGAFVRFLLPALQVAQGLGLIDIPDSFVADLQEMVVAMNQSKEGAYGAAGGLVKLQTDAKGADDATKALTQSLNAFFGASLSSSNAAIQFEGALDGVVSTLKENGRTLDINTEKGRQNVKQVNDTIAAAIAARDAKIKETGSVAEGNKVYSTYIERLRGVLSKAGLTKTQIDKLIGSYDEIPPEVSTDVNAPGLSAALAQAARLNAELDRINRRATTNPMGRGGDYTGVGGYAEGGVIRREHLAMVGEGNKPEAIVPLTNPKRAAEVMNEAGLSGMGGTIIVQLVMDGKVIEEKVVEVNQAQARQIQNQPRRVI